MARVKKEAGTIPVLVDEVEKAASVAAPLPSLKDVVEDAAKQTAVEQARAVVFGSANAATEKPVDPRFGALVERAFAPKDCIAALDRYEAWLELGERRTEDAFIRKAHEMGPRIVQDLFDAYIQSRQMRETWELENDVVFGSMREQATKALQGEKERGVRTKQITEKDVDTKCAAMFDDEWTRQETKRLRHKLTEDRMKFAIENAQLRCRILDSMMSRLR